MIEYLFDHLGLFVWLFVVVIAVIDLHNSKLKRWPRIVLLVVGVGGVLADVGFLLNFWLNLGFLYAWMFDSLGAISFVFIIWLSFSDLHNKRIERHYLIKWGLLVVGVLGLIADSFVLSYYLV
jgi:hypothetical protein